MVLTSQTILFLIFCGLIYGSSPTALEDKVARHVTEFMKEHGIHRSSVGVMHHGKLVFARDIERLDADQSIVRETVDTIPMLHLSHLITSLAVLYLSDKDMIDLNKKVFSTEGPLSGFLEAMPTSIDQRIKDITVVHLLQQTAGWSHNDEFSKSGVLLPSDVIRTMLKHKLHSAPGLKSKYTPFNEFLLRILIEDVSEISYEEFVKRKILIPLGLWKTKLRRSAASKAAAGLYNTNLIPTTWFMTIHDVMRLLKAICGHGTVPILRRDTLKLVFKRPEAPHKRHSEAWYGMGIRVRNDGTFWLESAESGQYLFIHSSGTTTTTFGKKHTDDITKSAFLVHFYTKKKLMLKHLMADYFKRIKSWHGALDLSNIDLFSATYHDEGVIFRVHEQHLSAYSNALRHAGYEPTWLHAYTEHPEQTNFVVISNKSADTLVGSKEKWILHHGLGENLERFLGHREQKGYQLQLIQNYKCYAHDSKKCTFVLMRMQKNKTSDLILANDGFKEYLRKVPEYHRNGYIATVQSVLTLNGHRHVCAILRQGANAYKPFLDLTIDDFERVIYEEALIDNNLAYMDSYVSGEQELRFSAVFKSGQAGRWILQQDLKIENLVREVEQLKQTKLFPKMIVGYSRNDTNYFSVFYTM